MSEQEASLEELAEAESVESGEQELFGLGEIPADWMIKPLSDIGEIIPGNSPPSSTYNEEGNGLPFFQGNSEFGYFHPKADTWCSDPRKEAEKNDVLMSIRAPVGDLNIANRNCCIGRGLAALRPKNANRFYLFYNLAERKPWLSRLATGSTFKSVTKSDLQLLDVPLPPLEEQRKIASVLYTVDQAIQKTEGIIEQTKHYKSGLKQDLLRSGLGEGPTKQVSTIGEIPEHWRVERLDELTEWVTDGTHTPYKAQVEGYPCLTGKNIRDYGFRLDDVKKVSEEAFEEMRSRVSPKKGDVLFVKDGSIGYTQVNDLDFEFGLLESVLLIRVDEDDIRPHYLQQLLTWDPFRELLISRRVGTGIERMTISGMKKAEIIVPPIEEQKELENILLDVDGYINKEETYLDRLKRLKQGLMQDLLSGEVRPHDKDIEIVDEVLQHG